MRRALLLLAGALLWPAPAAAEEGALSGLDLALTLHPHSREALYTLATFNEQAPLQRRSRVEPEAVVGAFEEMLRRHFRSVTRVEAAEAARGGRFHLVYDLNLFLAIGLLPGHKTDVHAIGHVHRPDGSKVEHLSVEAARVLAPGATSSLLLDAVLEARDKMEAALLASTRLSAFTPSLSSGPAAGVSPAPAGPGASAEIVWVSLPGGSFLMGSERENESPVHRVTVKPFRISRTEVTFGQYRACVRAGACSPAHVSDGTCYQHRDAAWSHGKLPEGFSGEDQPVVCVDWDQAHVFARWAGGRLPTEAEWEYAARNAGQAVEHPWGAAPADCSLAVLFDGADGCGTGASWPVCSKPAGNTEQGLCDMAGNVFEWVSDRDHAGYVGAPADGRSWEEGDSFSRVRRGGSWATAASGLRAAYRLRDRPHFRFASVGIRVVR